MLEIRDATAEELAQFANPAYETWGAVLEENGEKAGQIFLSRFGGQVLGHNTECNAKDLTGATRLWFHARKKVREWGLSEVHVHFHPDDVLMLPFWERLGFTLGMLIYKGEI